MSEAVTMSEETAVVTAARAGDEAAFARVTMPPHPASYVGRDAIIEFATQVHDPASPVYFGEWRRLPTRANRQPAAAGYVRRPGESVFRAQVLDVLRIEGGRIVEVTAFTPHLFPAFGLPTTL